MSSVEAEKPFVFDHSIVNPGVPPEMVKSIAPSDKPQGVFVTVVSTVG